MKVLLTGRAFAEQPASREIVAVTRIAAIQSPRPWEEPKLLALDGPGLFVHFRDSGWLEVSDRRGEPWSDMQITGDDA